MKPEDFTENKPGRLLRGVQGYWANVPAPLPPRLEADWETIGLLSDADRAIAELAGVARTLPNPHLLIRPFLRREAVLSSRIEGTQASLSDLFFYEAATEAPSVTSDVQEVANYVSALEYGLRRLDELPLSLRLIREMHAKLMAGVRGEHLTPGEFRRSQNWIGPPGSTLDDAVYVPPPVPEMLEALDALEKFLHAPTTLPPLIRFALIHYQFEAIHPFLDGNGRIGRLLITLLLHIEGVLPQPLLYLSAYFERHRPDYYAGLLGISREGKWMEWIHYFLRGVAEQSKDAVMRSHRLVELQKRYRAQLLENRASALMLRLADYLFDSPAVTITQVAETLGCTYRAADMQVTKLEKMGILTEFTGRQRGKVYFAKEIIAITETSATV